MSAPFRFSVLLPTLFLAAALAGPIAVPASAETSSAPDIVVSTSSVPVDFGGIFVGGSSADTVVVRNVGDASLTVAASATPSAHYAVSPTSFSVGPGATRIVLLTFAPSAIGVIGGELAVLSNDPDESDIRIPLTGVGVDPPVIDVAPTQLSAALLTDETEAQTITVSNAGTSELVWDTEIAYTQSARRPFVLRQSESLVSEPGTDAPPVRREFPELRASLADLTGVRILWDRAHSQSSPSSWSALVGDLQSRGAQLDENYVAVTPGVLGPYDVFWITDGYGSWSVDEISAMSQWVTDGGAVLLEGDNSETEFNGILAAFSVGIEIHYTNGVSGTTSGVYPHPTTRNVAAIYLSSPGSTLGITDPAGRLVDDSAGTSVVAQSRSGAGLVFVAGDEVFADYSTSQEDNRLFGNQVLDWLATGHWLSLDPASGTIAGGGSQTIDVGFDATSLQGGSYAADVQFLSNDPVTPELTVTADLEVTGVPDIEVTATSLDFGDVFVGASAIREFTATNVGTDSLHVTGTTIAPADFAVDGSSFALAPDQTRVISVTFTPGSAVAVLGTLEISSDDPDESPVSVSLVGIGIDPPVPSVSPASLSADLLSGESEIQSLQLANTGGSDLVWLAQTSAVDEVPYTLTVVDPHVDEELQSPRTPALARTSPPTAELNDLTGVRILWDRSHGQSDSSSWSTVLADLTLRGATIEVNFAPVTPTVLDGVHVFWSEDAYSLWSASEIQAIALWVEAGGGLLLEGGYDSDEFDELLVALDAGIEITGGRYSYGTTTNVFPHPTTEDVGAVFLDYGSWLSVSEPAGRLVADFADSTVVAFSRSGLGRIVVGGSFLFVDSFLGSADNQLFGNQVIDWLAGPRWLDIEPRSGTLPAAGIQPLQAVFDATRVPGGAYSLQVVFTTNAPGAPDLTVPVALNVTGNPEIEVPLAALDFGGVFVGGTETRFVTVENVGTLDLVVSSADVDPADYTVTPAAFTVPPGATAELTVAFSPASAGDRNGVLKILSNDLDEDVVTVPLTGRGMSPPVANVQPVAITGDLLAGAARAETLTVANDGVADLTWNVTVGSEAAPRTWLLTDPPDQPTYPDQDEEFPPATGSRGTALYARLEDLTDVRILWDLSHSQGSSYSWSTLVSDLTTRGATLVESYDPITPEHLAEFDVLWTIDSYGWTTAQESAVAEWIEAGGGLLLEGDETTTDFNEILAAAGAGITFGTSSAAYGLTTNVYSHPITEGVGTIQVPGPYDRLLSPDPPAITVVDDYLGTPVIQVAEVGQGRIVACADEFFGDYVIGTADNQVLGNQAFDWLAGAGWLLVEPRVGTVGAGGTNIVVATLDAELLSGGVYEAHIRFATNDPLAAEVIVPVELTVTDAPDIAVDAETVDFGLVYLGGSETRTVTVGNEGTGPLTVTSATTAPDEYSVSPTNFTLAPDETRELLLVFTPDTPGAVPGELRILSDDPDRPDLVVALTAVGDDPPNIELSTDALHQDLVSGQIAHQTLELRNTGLSDLVWEAVPTFVEEARVVRASDVFGSDLRADPSRTKAEAEEIARRGPPAPVHRAPELEAPSPRSAAAITVGEGTPPLEDLLETIDAQLDQFSAAIPNRYDFSDGVSGTSISDGGGDMYDGGNYLHTDLGGPLAYSDGILAVSPALGSGGRYFTRKGTGVFLLAADLDGVQSFQITGNLGADGYGSADGVVLQASVPGRSFTGFVKRVYGAYNPSVNHLIIVETAAGLTHEFATDTNSDYHEVDGLGSTSRLYLLVFAGTSGYGFDDSTVLTLFETFLGSLELAPGWIDVAPAAGILAAGQDADLTITFDAVGLPEGDYGANILFSSNDPDEPAVTLPTLLHLRGEARLEVDPAVLNFGAVFAGDSSTTILTLTNVGFGTLFVSSVTATPADFSVTPSTLQIPAGEESDVRVTFAPSGAGPVTGEVAILSNDVDEPDRRLVATGLGVEPPDVVVTPTSLAEHLQTGETSVATLTLENTGAANLTFGVDAAWTPATPGSGDDPSLEDVLLRLTAGLPVVADAIPSRYDFQDGTSGYYIYDGGNDMYDSGNRLGTDLGMSISYSDGAIATSYLLGSGGRYFTKKVPGLFVFVADLDGNEEFRIEGNLGADGAGISDGAVLEATAAGRSFTGFVKRVSGAVNPSVNHLVIIESDAAASHDFATSTDDDYHAVQGLSGSTRLYYLLYAGTEGHRFDDDATRDIMASFLVELDLGPPWIDVAPRAGIVPPGGSVPVAVGFDATGLFGGTYAADLVVTTNDPDETTTVVPAVLTVTGAPDIDPAETAVDFGPLFVGASEDRALVIRNVGTDSLRIATSATPADFSVAPATLTIAAADSGEVLITFAPQSAVPIAGELTILSDDPDEPDVRVTLAGEGLDPPIVAVTPTSLTADLVIGETCTELLSLANTGTSDLVWSIGIEYPDPVRQSRTLTVPPAPSAHDEEGVPGSVPTGAPRSSPLVADLADLTGVRVLWDRSHGQPWASDWSTLVTDIQSRGAEFVENFDLLTEERLSEFDILWSADTYSWAVTEVEATADWVAGGGALLLEGDNSSTVDAFNALLSAIGSGIVLSYSGGASGTSGEIFQHPTTEGVSEIYFSGPVAQLSAASPAVLVANDYLRHGMAAADEPDAGLVFVVTDEIFANYVIGSSDNQLFGNQVFDWLAGVGWLDVQPRHGTLPGGTALDLAVTFDATDLLGGTYPATLTVESNDPITPTVDVPVTLTVTGAPAIHVSSTSIEFGDTYVGGEDTRTLSVANHGSDLLTVSAIAVDAPEFSADPTSFSVAAGAEQQVALTFAPSAPAVFTGNLTISSNDPDEPEIAVALLGEGIAPPEIALSPESIEETIVEGQVSSLTITVANEGMSDLTFSAFAREPSAGAAPPRIWAVPEGTGPPEVTGAFDATALRAEYAKSSEPHRSSSPERRAVRLDSKRGPVPPSAGHARTAAGDDGVVFYDDMETGAGNWTAYATAGALTTWAPTTTSAHSGSTAWSARRHPAAGSEALRSPEIDLASLTDAWLCFWHRAEFDDCGIADLEPDGGVVEISGDGGQTWTSLVPEDGYPFSLDDTCDNPLALHPAYSHATGPGFVPALFDLTAWVGETVSFRFHAGWDCGNCDGPSEAWFVDDVVVFTQAPTWLTLSAPATVVAPGESADITVQIDGAALALGPHSTEIVVASNDPDESEVVVPVQVTVISDPTSTPEPALPRVHALHASRPNPFRHSTTIGFDLPTGAAVTLEIFDVTGRRVRTAVRTVYPAGRHQVIWDGRDDGGSRVSTGIYFYRFQAGDFARTRRMLVLR